MATRNTGQPAGAPAAKTEGIAAASEPGQAAPPSYSGPNLQVWNHTVDFLQDAHFKAAVCKYIDFNHLDKAFYLFDTYCGIPPEQMSEREKSQGRIEMNKVAYRECYEATQASFAAYPRARLVRGKVPDSLSTVSIERVCYLSIDMNVVAPEIAAIEHFWPKLSAGAPVILDDYGKTMFIDQKLAMDEFAARRGVKILNLPTGQGLLLKS